MLSQIIFQFDLNLTTVFKRVESPSALTLTLRFPLAPPTDNVTASPKLAQTNLTGSAMCAKTSST